MTLRCAVDPGVGRRRAGAARRSRLLALALVLGCKQAGATALGGAATSMGLFAALATLFALRAWPERLPDAALPVTGAALVAGGLAWLWRSQGAARRIVTAGQGRPVAPVRVGGPAAAARDAVVALPPGIDRSRLLDDVRTQFVRLQAAWDLGEAQALRALTTPEMLGELCFDWPGMAHRTAPNRTDVVTLEAALLAFDEFADLQLVTVEFSGLIRECDDQGAMPFRELWMLAKSTREGSGWRLARQQSLL